MLETGLRGANRAHASGSASGDHFLIYRFVPTLQSLFLLLGQGETGRGLVNRHDQLSVDRGEGRVGDIATPKSATDDHTEGVGVDILDICGGFDDATSDDAGLLPGQFCRTERIGEDVVVQTRDATEPIDRDGTGFVGNVRTRRVLESRSGYSLSLSGLTPAGTRAEHLDDGVGSDGGKAVRDGSDGKLLDGLPHFLNPNHIVFLCRDADVGVLVEHLVDRDEVLIPIVVTARKTQAVSEMRCDVPKMHTRSSRRKDQYDPEPYPRDDPRSPWRPWQCWCS